MLVSNNQLNSTEIYSFETGQSIAKIIDSVINPNNLIITAYVVTAPLLNCHDRHILSTRSIIESQADQLTVRNINSIVEFEELPELHDQLDKKFKLLDLRVVDQQNRNLGRINDYNVNTDDFSIQQISINPLLRRQLVETARLIHRSQIKEVGYHKIIIDDTSNKLTESSREVGQPLNFANPFRRAPKPTALINRSPNSVHS